MRAYRRLRMMLAAIVLVTLLICIGILIKVKREYAGEQTALQTRQEAAAASDGADGGSGTLTDSETEGAGQTGAAGENVTAGEGQDMGDASGEGLSQEGLSQEAAAQEEQSQETVSGNDLIITGDPSVYTYADMEADLHVMQKLYGNLLTVRSLGTTADGRTLYDLVIGGENAGKQFLINAGIHAREYMTCQLVMKQAAVFLQRVSAQETYGETTYSDLLSGCAVHIVPMVNPDGIAISQEGLNGLQTEAMKAKVQEIAALDGERAEGYYLTRWKANANGVDLNRNFDALWELYAGADHPSCDHYKGTSVGCEAESAALISLTQKQQFCRTISYHTQGNVIYWYFAQEGSLYEETLGFAERIASLTGYPLDADYENLDPAGYKDWAISKMQIPSLTIEVGSETSPVPVEQFPGIWEKNCSVIEEMLLDAKG